MRYRDYKFGTASKRRQRPRGTYTEVEGKAIGANALADASRVAAARSIFAMVGYEREKWRKVHEKSIDRPRSLARDR